MTENGAQPSITQKVASHTTCTLSTVSQLKTLFFPPKPTQAVEKSKKIPAQAIIKSQAAQPSSRGRGRVRKQPDVAIYECPGEIPSSTKANGEKLATEIINAVLKAFTDAVKSQKIAHQSCTKTRPKSAAKSNPAIASPTSQRHVQSPLQTRSTNIISTGNCRQKGSQQPVCSDGMKAASGFHAQAECARLAFSALKTYNAHKSSAKQLPFIQLENAMSALINKLLALELLEPAYRQLCALKEMLVIAAGIPTVDMVPLERTGKKEQMADLLILPITDTTGPLLTIAVTFQFQVLQLIAAKGEAALYRATIEHLQLTNPCSPIRLIQAQDDPTDTCKRNRTACQLEALSRLVLSMCPNTSSSEDHTSSRSNMMDPLTAFRFELLALELRPLWWAVAGHRKDLGKDLLEPFSRYLSTFRRRCSKDLQIGYNMAKKFLASLKSLSQKESLSVSTPATWYRAWCCIYTELIEIARQCCLLKDTEIWLKEYTDMPAGDGGSPCQRCIVVCRQAVIYAQNWTDSVRKREIVRSFRNVEQQIQEDLHGDSAELDELLLAVIALRRTAASLLNKSRTLLKDHETPLSSELRGQCYSIFSTCVKFLSRYIGNKPQTTADMLNRRYKQRLENALPVVQTFVDTVISIARLFDKDNLDEWTLIDDGLQACIGLATVIQEIDQDAPKKDGDTKAACSIFVKVSNAYWSRYQYLKQSNSVAKEILKTLGASIDAVKDRPITEQQAAQMHTRIERYGIALETAREHRKASEIYSKGIKNHIDQGILQKAALAAATVPVSILSARETDFASFGRVLLAYLRVANKAEVKTTSNENIFDDNKLDPVQRGIVLEYQLILLTTNSEVDSIVAQANKTLQYLVTELLGIYSEQLFPIRRLRVTEILMWVQLNRPDVLAPSVVEQLSCRRVDTAQCGLHGADSGLRLLAPYLNASVDAIHGVREKCPTQKQQKLKSAIAYWYDLVEQSADLETLEARVGDVHSWLLRVELIAQYLDAYGMDLQRRSVLHLLCNIREKLFPTEYLQLITNMTLLGVQHLRLGSPSQAGLALHKASKYIHGTDAPKDAVIRYFVAYSEYFLLIGNPGKCEENLAQARERFGSWEGKDQNVFGHDRVKLLQLMADVALLYSQIATRQGHPPQALVSAHQSMRLAERAWAMVEKRQKTSRTGAGNTDTLLGAMSRVTVSDNGPLENVQLLGGTASMYWPLVPQLHRAYLQVGRLYESEGLFQGAKYYMERSQKLAEKASASGLLCRSLSHFADTMSHSGNYTEAKRMFDTANDRVCLLEEDCQRLEFQKNLTNHYLLRGQLPDAEQSCAAAELIIQRLTEQSSIHSPPHEPPDVFSLQEQLSELTIGKNTSRQPKTQKRAHPKNTTNEDVEVGKVLKAGIANLSGVQVSSSKLRQLKYVVLRQRIEIAVQENKLQRAAEFLEEAVKQVCTPLERVLNAMSSAEVSIIRGLDAIKSDAVYCILPESTVGLPSVLPQIASEVGGSPKALPGKVGKKPVNAGPVGYGGKRVRAAPKVGHADLGNDFRKAQADISKVYHLASSICSTITLQHLSKIAVETLFNLSALSLPVSEEGLKPTPDILSGVSNMARSASVIRGKLAFQCESKLSLGDDLDTWPDGPTRNMQPVNQTWGLTAFREQFIDIIPRDWQVLTVSLSRSRHEIVVSRIRSGQSPFILSLPLDRHSSRDTHEHEESFGYSQAKSELQEIIAFADYSMHETLDTSRKGTKSAWWEGRAALDARLKDLLTNIEYMWFGGFQGVFSQQMPNRGLLSRFQESLSVALDNHLPSRQGLGKVQRGRQISLDPRVVELFVALGDPALFSDMEEPLMDLLYFVIDILQFHGERNAYDEIDFDSMTLEIFDALRQYHEAAKKADYQSAINHTILVLDKELHCFPWESLPCLDGHAVTRLPSLSCLRERILQGQQRCGTDSSIREQGSFSVDRRSGAYILNPAGDLRATQATFEQPLGELCEWKGVTERVPSEAQIKEYLQEQDIFLYLGHGSGSQYIRSRTIQKLERCAVALLMGCSSGKLTEAGKFEPYGPPMSYIQAGCPAMVATLWDVTDKDIDRFSRTMLQKWGLLQNQPPANSSPVKKSARAKGKSKVQQSPPPPPDRERLSLDQAVAHGRGSCIFRYLNGAAPVVYGIPIFLS